MALDIDESKVRRNELVLWLEWTLATAAGMLAGFLPFALFIETIDLWLARLLVPLWAGFLVGLFQWLVLRSYLTHSVDWILNGGAGWSLGYALGLMVIQVFNDSLLGVLAGYALFGLVVGLLQWPVLRREIPSVWSWVSVSILGWGLGAFGSQLILNAITGGQPVGQAVSAGVVTSLTGLIAGGLTGLAFVWIVRQPERELFRDERTPLER